MAKYSGLKSATEGVTTANQDLYALAKSNKGWTKYTPWVKFSFIPTADCDIKINGDEDTTPVKADIGWSDDDTQVTEFIVVDDGIEYILGYRY